MTEAHPRESENPRRAITYRRPRRYGYIALFILLREEQWRAFYPPIEDTDRAFNPRIRGSDPQLSRWAGLTWDEGRRRRTTWSPRQVSEHRSTRARSALTRSRRGFSLFCTAGGSQSCVESR